MSWIRKNKGNIILIFLSLIFALVVSEIVLRIVIKPQAEFGVIEDDILGYVAKPESGWDDNGFRNKFVPNKVDVVVMGDSQTQGINAEMSEAWPQVLAQISRKSVYQIAFIERGVVQQYYLLDKALELNPDHVILAFYMGNDLLDAYNLVYQHDYWKFLRRDDIDAEFNAVRSENVREMVESGLSESSFKFKILKLRNLFRQNSRIYTLLANATRDLRERVGLSETSLEKEDRLLKWTEQNPDLAFVYKDESQKTIMSPSYRLDTLNFDNKATVEGWRISQELILKMKEILSSKNKDFSIILIPTKERVYVDFMKARGQEVPESLGDVVIKEKEVLYAVENFCLENDIRCFDVSYDLSRALLDGQIIYPKSLDGHPLPGGYRKIAESVGNYLKELELEDNIIFNK